MIPLNFRGSYADIHTYLRSQGYTGAFNDALYAFLRDEGHEGALPDRWKGYILSEGYTGAFNDMFYKWSRGLSVDRWLLRTGVWDDEGIWFDDATWSDS